MMTLFLNDLKHFFGISVLEFVINQLTYAATWYICYKLILADVLARGWKKNQFINVLQFFL